MSVQVEKLHDRLQTIFCGARSGSFCIKSLNAYTIYHEPKSENKGVTKALRRYFRALGTEYRVSSNRFNPKNG
jgi:hypothetical protein